LDTIKRVLASKRNDREVRTDGGTTDSREARTEGGTVADEGRLSRLTDSDFWESSPFWLPPFLLMGFFVYGAIGWNLLISLTDYRRFGDIDYSNLDLEMYRRAFGDPSFIEATKNTFVLIVAFIAVCLVIGLLLAILLDRQIRFKNGFRTVYLLPMSLSFVVTAQF
jgi:glucose/mannose transport system permease protein